MKEEVNQNVMLLLAVLENVSGLIDPKIENDPTNIYMLQISS